MSSPGCTAYVEVASAPKTAARPPPPPPSAATPAVSEAAVPQRRGGGRLNKPTATLRVKSATADRMAGTKEPAESEQKRAGGVAKESGEPEAQELSLEITGNLSDDLKVFSFFLSCGVFFRLCSPRVFFFCLSFFVFVCCCVLLLHVRTCRDADDGTLSNPAMWLCCMHAS